jgi:FXSXX-COOH protein
MNLMILMAEDADDGVHHVADVPPCQKLPAGFLSTAGRKRGICRIRSSPAGGTPGPSPHAESAGPTVRSTMADGAAGNGLIDISGLSLDDLLVADESSLSRALERVLSSDSDVAYNSFNASI